MKNICDILVNFKKNAYEFYEWNYDDNIKHIKKIPSFKVDDNTLLDFINYNIIIDKAFLALIEDKTELYQNKGISKLKYSFILFNNEIALAFVLDDNGMVIGKSKLLFDESDDIVINNNSCDLDNIKYKKINKNNYNKKLTRKENNEILLIIKYIDKIYKENKKEELNYLYFECFNKKINNYNESYKVLKNNILNGNKEIIHKLKTLIKVIKK